MMTPLLRRIFFLLTFACVASIAAQAQGLGDLPPVKTPKPKIPTPTTPRPRITPTPKPKAIPKSTPTPKLVPTSPVSYKRAPATLPQLSFNQPTAGNLDPKTSGRITATSFYDEYKLTATGADLFTIQLQTSNPSLAVQIYDNNQAGQPILKDPQSGDFKLNTPNSTLPGDGEYRVRVLGTIAEEKSPAIAYTLNIKRSGLTEEGYTARLQQIVTAYNSAGGKNAEETISKIEELIAADPNKAKGYETLAAAYLYNRNDQVKAVSFMETAIKLGGAAMFKVTHDSQGRRPEKKGDGFEFTELRTSWLYIRPDQITLIDTADSQRIYFSVGGKQLLEVSRIGQVPMITIKQSAPRSKPYLIRPVTKNQAESDIIVNLIKNYVLRKN